MKSTDSCKTTRVTISIPQEAGESLKHLVRFNTQLLSELGILAVQVDGTKPVVVDAKRNTHFPDSQARSLAVASLNSNDLMSECWKPGEKDYSHVTPICNQSRKQSRDLVMVPYRNCLFPASENLYIPNGRVNNCHNIASTPKLKTPEPACGLVFEKHEQSQQCTANHPFYGHRPSFVSLAMPEKSSCFGLAHQPPELARTGIPNAFHIDPLSNSVRDVCNDLFDAVFEPSRATKRLRRRRRKASSTALELQEEVNQTYSVPAAKLVKTCVPNKTLNSSDNILPVPRQSQLDSNVGCVTLTGVVSNAQNIGMTTGSLSETVVSECEMDFAIGSSSSSGNYERSRQDLNFSEKADLKFSSTVAPVLDAAFPLAADNGNLHIASEGHLHIASEGHLHIASEGQLSNPNSPTSQLCELKDDPMFSCAIPEMCHDESKINKAVSEPCAYTSCGTLTHAASPSSENYYLNDKSGILENVPSGVELSSGYAVSESGTIEMASSLSCASSEVNLSQTSCLHQPNPEPAFDCNYVECSYTEKASFGLLMTSCARKLSLTEEVSGSDETALGLQVSAETEKARGRVSSDLSRSELDVQPRVLNVSSQTDELNSDLNADRSAESFANELNTDFIQKAALSLDKDLSCLASRLGADDVGRLLPLSSQLSSDDCKLSSDDCTVVEELNNSPLENAEPLLPELQLFHCDLLSDDASGCLSEMQQHPEAFLSAILADDVECIDTSSVSLQLRSSSTDSFSESACVADVAAASLVAETLTPLFTSKPSQEMLQRIDGVSPKPGQEYESISILNGSEEPEDAVLDNNLTDQDFIKSRCQVGLRRRSSDTDQDWSDLSEGDIKVITLNNRQSALDLHRPRFEELSVCSTSALADDLRRLNAIVCEFDSLAVKSSSLLCVTKLTNRVESRLQSKKVRIVKAGELLRNTKTKRERNGLFSNLEKHRMEKKACRDVRMFNKDHSYLINDDLNVPLVSVPAAKKQYVPFNSSDP